MRQKEREQKWDNYHPICLSDLESDDEWIAETEDHVLDPTDISWMDMHEAFEEGDASTKKRKRVNIKLLIF